LTNWCVDASTGQNKIKQRKFHDSGNIYLICATCSKETHWEVIDTLELRFRISELEKYDFEMSNKFPDIGSAVI